MSLRLLSNAFSEGGLIPNRHAGDGENLSPDLCWSGVPDSTRSFALVVDDPDAPSGTFTHWVVYNIPGDRCSLPEGLMRGSMDPSSMLQGNNDYRRIGYDGPKPPHGTPHRYYFKLYALDMVLDLPAGCSAADLFRAMQGHILSTGHLLGIYRRWK